MTATHDPPPLPPRVLGTGFLPACQVRGRLLKTEGVCLLRARCQAAPRHTIAGCALIKNIGWWKEGADHEHDISWVDDEVLNVDELLGRCMGIAISPRACSPSSSTGLRRTWSNWNVPCCPWMPPRWRALPIASEARWRTSRLHNCRRARAEIEQWGRAGRLEDAAGGVQRLCQQWTQFAGQASALHFPGDVP